MSENLKCIGTEEITINYEFFRYSTRRFDYYGGQYDDQSSQTISTVYDFTEQGLTHTLSGNLISINNPENRLYPNTYANLVAFSGGVKVLDLLEFSADIQDTTPEALIESEIYDFLVTTNFPFLVTDTPSSTENKSYTHNKLYKDSGIKILIEKLFDERLTRLTLQEIRVSDNFIITSKRIENSTSGTVKNYSLICDGGCPPNTCEVDCGDKMCCYGADGIPINFYYK